MSHICPVCGYPDLKEESRGEAVGGSFEICPSCGIQFGLSDEVGGNVAKRLELYGRWRQQWIDGGMVWDRGRTRPPVNWDPVEQLGNVARADKR